MTLNSDPRSTLAQANHILASKGVLDAYGHVSLRDPDHHDRFLLARSMGPELVTVDDLQMHDLCGNVISAQSAPSYLERFIHAAVYAARPECNCVVHGHAEPLLPFGITGTPLLPVIHDASDLVGPVPVWDIATNFGDDTDMLVTSMEMGRDLVATLGDGPVALMRGHGFVAAGNAITQVVRMCVYLLKNARVLTAARLLNPDAVRGLSAGELRARKSRLVPDSPAMMRAWQTWAREIGADTVSPEWKVESR